MFDALGRLNPAQRDAVEHPGGPLLVVAGAGSGKTWTLACRVARLVERGVRPERILLLTFTRRAAREMLSRAERLTGDGTLGRVWGGTFHGLGNRLLRIHGRPIGVPADFTVLDRTDTADLMDLIRGELGLGQGKRRFPRKETLADIYSRTVNAQERLSAVLERDFPWCADQVEGMRSIFERYTERKRAQRCLDYDDLLVYWRALSLAPGAGARIAGMFEHVLVDEYQDTNALQADILEALKPDGEGLMVVGDDAQSIYSFRAATVRNILEFPARFPGTTIVRLEQNYRSTQPILDATNAVIALSPQRHEKTLWSERATGARPRLLTCLDEPDQSEAVCRAVLENRERGVLLKDQAVLFRAAHHSDLLEVELSRRNVPFVKYGGLAFMESAHVKDALAVLRLLDNPRDEVSWFRVLQLLDGVGPATARRLMVVLGVVGEDPSGRSPLAALLQLDLAVPAPARPELEDLRGVVRDCADDVPPSVQLERVRRFLEPILARRYDRPDARLRDLEQLEQLAVGYPTRERFVTDLTLDPPSATGDLAGPPLLDEDYLVLSTIHSAKGGEWDVVHVIHAADGMIPSDMATGDRDQIEEERRLFYVALTRARDELRVYAPLRYHRRNRGREDRHLHAQLTRFLPPAVLDRFERRTTSSDPDRAPGGAVTVSSSGPGSTSAGMDGTPAEVDRFLTGLWALQSGPD
ncbi:MAG TPA: ATP-dependent helicase [Actinomycetota bacterium]|jgi:DNA helicase-2/ATP-dependent DNA helicase PcrA|nr:ATP-dependent helicase [Actinomycetota bacterium]